MPNRRRSLALAARALPTPAARCRRKFLRYFPNGFSDETYLDWERGYKQKAHEAWTRQLGRAEMDRLILRGDYREVATRAVRIESRTNLLFSFEKMALRDAVRTNAGAKPFAEGLRACLYGRGGRVSRFERWGEMLSSLPRKQTRVHTWPLQTVFGFIASPEREMFLKPNVTRVAAAAYGVDFYYESRPRWETYASLLEFAETVRRDQQDLGPRDMIDLQGFIWVAGSDEYPW
jgi:hypothetical protein